MEPSSVTRPRSIERTLPLLISVLLLAAVGGSTWTAYERVRGVLVSAGGERLRNASSVTALLMGQALARYRSGLAAAAADPALGRYLADGAHAHAARVALAAAWSFDNVPRTRSELRRRDGTVVLDTARGTVPRGSGWIDRAIDAARLVPGEPAVGPLHTVGDSTLVETIVPIATPAGPARAGGSADGGIAGYLSVVGFLSVTGARPIRDLIGGQATVLMGSPAEGDWTTLERPAAPPSARVEPGRPVVFAGATGGTRIGAASLIVGTPWALWVEQPLDVVLAPMHELLGQMMAVAGLFVLVAVGGAWVISRQITSPLVALTEAAEQVARAEPRIAPAGGQGDEIERLTDAFRRMARRVHDSLAIAEAARADAESSNQAKGVFLATISHELRTPLNAITGYAALLEDGIRGALSHEQANDVGRIRRAAQHLLGLITDLLDFAKLEAGEVRVGIMDVPVQVALAEAATMVDPQARAKQLTVECQPVAPGLAARADRDKVLQILLNLLSNAIKFTRAGGRVVMSAAAADEQVRIVVRDTGRGIARDQLARVFDPFVQVGRRLAAPGEGGVGLGLAISRELAQVMGGTLTVDSAVGEGSTFVLTLPRGAGGVEPPQGGTVALASSSARRMRSALSGPGTESG